MSGNQKTITNKELFLNLMQQHRKIIFKICNSYCRNKNEREDLAQEILYQLWKSFETFDPENNDPVKFSTWMYRVALNVAISFYRKDRKADLTDRLDDKVFEIASGEDISDVSEAENNFSLLQKFINELNELDRALILLYLEENSYKEIGEILGITETNVATKISRIKEKLKQKFNNAQK
ncbi:MAG: sigma-70 family RNA polymerase sigma factor [Ignavibacteriae bacterium]|nr:sigma-70 family RNA polymerase sigma factor [Ignavibacteriota bacterium]